MCALRGLLNERDKSCNMKESKMSTLPNSTLHYSRSPGLLDSTSNASGSSTLRCPRRRRPQRWRGRKTAPWISTYSCVYPCSRYLTDLLTPCTVKFEGPWFTTQLTISLTIGVLSFLIFSYSRTRWPLLFAPRTKLKGEPEQERLFIVLTYPQASHRTRHTPIRRSLAG